MVRASILSIGRLADSTPLDATEGMAVEKSGRTTGFTTGKVTDLSADVRINYDSGTFTFQNQIIVEGNPGPFSQAGDSGSLIVARINGRLWLCFLQAQTRTRLETQLRKCFRL